MKRALASAVALVAALAGMTAPAFAGASPINLTSKVFVEREIVDSSGRRSVVLEQPSKVVPGDRLVFVVNYHNASQQPASRFMVTNPMPSAVAFERTQDGSEEVSIDGGRNWGRLADLRIPMIDGGVRAATPEDVTHIRWFVPQTLGAGSGGKLSFRGTVK